MRSVRTALLVVLAGFAPNAGQAQETLERSPNVDGGWIGPDGLLHVHLPYRLMSRRDDAGMVGVPTFQLGLGLTGRALVGGRFAPGSPTVAERPDEWEVFGRIRLLEEALGRPVDFSTSAAYNGAARSIDGDIALARWIGPARLLAAGRVMGNAYDAGDVRIAVSGGAVLHPLSRRAPIALAADLGTLLDREGGELVAWSAAIQLGVSHTTHTLSLFATNTGTSTLQGSSRGEDRIRWGIELTALIPVGRLLGWYVPREEAREAVVTDADPATAPAMFHAEARDYLFFPRRIVIPAGTTIEWTNNDEVVHTVTATDGSWDSGGIQPGDTWRARFDRPGRYPFLCSPHPFMQGVVIVR